MQVGRVRELGQPLYTASAVSTHSGIESPHWSRMRPQRATTCRGRHRTEFAQRTCALADLYLVNFKQTYGKCKAKGAFCRQSTRPWHGYCLYQQGTPKAMPCILHLLPPRPLTRQRTCG
jgi:hypothetical protein